MYFHVSRTPTVVGINDGTIHLFSTGLYELLSEIHTVKMEDLDEKVIDDRHQKSRQE